MRLYWLKRLSLPMIVLAVCLGAFALQIAASFISAASASEEEHPIEVYQKSAQAKHPIDKTTPSNTKIVEGRLKSRHSIEITWRKSKNADGYNIYRLTKAGKWERIETINKRSMVTFTDTGLTYGKTYRYAVRAFKKHGGELSFGDYPIKAFSKRLKVKSKYENRYRFFYDMDGNRICNIEPFIRDKSSYLIKVNISENVMTIYAKDGKRGYTIPVKSYLCSGNVHDKLGKFTLGYKYRFRTLFYHSFSQWTAVIHGNILFHTVPYRKSKNPNSLMVSEYNKLGMSASHGCIRLQCQAVKWLYDNCDMGTKVIFYKNDNPGPFGKPELEKIPSWHTWDPTDPTMKHKCRKAGCNHKPI